MLLSMALVGWIRLLPLSLGTVEDRADRIARSELRERLSREVPVPAASQPRPEQADELVQQWIDRHPAELAAATMAVARRLRSELTYTGEDGREHVYLGDLDSYLWLRHARNYLRTGSPCDAVVDGVCRDTYTNAPVGARSIYARSLHVATIAGLHEVVTWFRPATPLPATAFVLQVLVSVLGVLPAFFIARGLAGTTAGVFAGVLTAVHPIVLTRTLGSDNDVWNAVLPVFVVWAVMAALGAVTSLRGALWAALAGAVVGLQAWAWRGWLFSYVVVIAGLLGAALVQGARHAIRHRTPRFWRAADVRRTALVLVVLCAVGEAGASLAGAEESSLPVLAKAIDAFGRSLSGDRAGGDAAPDGWPSALIMVAELAPLRLSGIAAATGGAAAFVASLLGLLLLLLPSERWRWWHRALLGVGALVYGYAVLATDPGRGAALVLLSAPLAAALIAQLRVENAPGAARQGVAFVVVVWYVAAVATAYDGLRFMLLLAPPFGIACAVLIGRLNTWVGSLIDAMPRWYRMIGVGLLAMAVAVALVLPLRWAHAKARSYTPVMHDAWWDALTHLRDTAHPDAIVHAWWDYGHWVKYVAERRVSNDGSSLGTHVPHWLARALVAPTERESIGVLRMLSCGSDATPLPEAVHGAYGKLRAAGRDPVAAYGIVSDLATVDDPATANLARLDLTVSARVDTLRSTHCDPPEAYLILNSGLVATRRSWMAFGLWDPRGGQPIARREMLPVPFVARWIPCRAGAEGHICEIGSAISPGGPTVDAFTYRSGSPQDGRLHGPERGRPSSLAGAGTPAAVLLAGAEHLREVQFASAAYPDLAVLIDVPAARILVGAPRLLRSTFVHLMYLDGRYATRYRRHDERVARGERIVVWKIAWKGT